MVVLPNCSLDRLNIFFWERGLVARSAVFPWGRGDVSSLRACMNRLGELAGHDA